MLAAVELHQRLGLSIAASLAPKKHFSESEKKRSSSTSISSTTLPLVAVAQDAGRSLIVGGGRYVVVAATGTAEVAFAVIDDYQGQGIGAALLRHLTRLAHDAGIKELIAEVLPENIPMLKVFQNSGLSLQTKHRAGVVEVALKVSRIAKASTNSYG